MAGCAAVVGGSSEEPASASLNTARIAPQFVVVARLQLRGRAFLKRRLGLRFGDEVDGTIFFQSEPDAALFQFKVCLSKNKALIR